MITKMESKTRRIHAAAHRRQIAIESTIKDISQRGYPMTLDEAVRHMNCFSSSTVAGWVSRGEIPHVKQGRKVVFYSEELNKYLELMERRPYLR